jgi:predicted HTH domain antitoxin
MSKTLSTRVDRETEEELRFYMRAEKVDKATAVRKLLEIGVQGWRREMAIQLLRDGKATVWRAAAVAGLPLWDFISLIDERKVILPISGKDVIGDVRSAAKGKG